MTRPVTFGVIGGYGGTGRAVVSHLWNSGQGEILVGGRDLTKTKAVAAEFDCRVSAAQVDALEPGTLNDFCSRCSVVINCAAPAIVVQDAVAQAALRNRAHYVDPGGFSLVKQRLLPSAAQIADSELSFVLSAGWVPGLTEVLPLYAYARALTRMDTIESVSMYFGDSSMWSSNALRDGVWYTRHTGHRRLGYFQRGKWVAAPVSKSYPRMYLGARLGGGRFCLCSTPELDEVGSRLSDCDFFGHAYLAGFRVIMAGAVLRLFPLPQSLSVRLMRTILQSARLPVGGFVAAQVVGRSQGQIQVLQAEAVYHEGRQYWANGLIPAVAARMVSENKSVMRGVHFLAEAVEPLAFIGELRKCGLEQTESSSSSPAQAPQPDGGHRASTAI